MEKWNEVYNGLIPNGDYQTLVQNGEESGLTIELKNESYNVVINFGIISAFRMIDEGILLNEIFLEKEIEEFEKNNYSNIIYEVKHSEFDTFIKNASNELYEYLELKHYVVITMNYVIQVIGVGEPSITVTRM